MPCRHWHKPRQWPAPFCLPKLGSFLPPHGVSCHHRQGKIAPKVAAEAKAVSQAGKAEGWEWSSFFLGAQNFPSLRLLPPGRHPPLPPHSTPLIRMFPTDCFPTGSSRPPHLIHFQLRGCRLHLENLAPTDRHLVPDER